jgi:hypothetical protein
MARLPTAEDLGPTPRVDPARSIASVDLSPIARGNAALEQGGQALGAGVQKFGAGSADYADAEQRFQFMQTHADYLAKSIDVQQQFQNDQDYATLPQRYNAALTTLRDQTAQGISSPGYREHFMSTSDETIARGNAWAAERQYKLSNEADVGTTDATLDNLAGQFAKTQDETQRQQIIGTAGALIDSAAAKGLYTPAQAYQLKHQWGHQLAATDAITRIQNGDAQGVLNELRTAPGSSDQIDNRIIQIESGGNPLARSRSSSAFGLSQAVSGTWLQVMRQAHPEFASMPDDQVLALRADPGLSREFVGLYRQQNASYLQSKGVEATPGNIYLAHFLGPAGAAAIANASPNMPASMVLANTVGASQAAAMVRANPSILAGKTAGSVSQWSADKMGGVGPGGGHLYDILTPEDRATISARASEALHQQTTDGLSDLKQRVDNTLAEAGSNGAAQTPVTQEEFIARLGPQLGAQQYQVYSDNLQASADLSRVAKLAPDDQQKLLDSYTPEPGADNYADQLKRQSELAKQIQEVHRQVTTDPGTFAVARLPAVQASYQNLGATLSDPRSTPQQKAAAAADFATKQTMEQTRIGVAPSDVKILPEGYRQSFEKAITKSATADDPQARVAVIARVQQEQALWGDNWPAVMRELAPSMQPMVRAIAAGADTTAMTRLLALGKDEKPADILKQQDTAKASDLQKSLNDTMAPFLGTLVGRQRDADYTGYYNLANTLGALYVRDGMSASDAATKAFGDLVGNRYDFRDSYRIPKSANVSADDVQAGAQVARGQIAAGALAIKPSIDNMSLGAGNEADTRANASRDGRFVTSPDNSGLNLVAPDGTFVRAPDGTPFKLGWQQLTQLAAGGRAAVLSPPPTGGTHREFTARQGGVAPDNPSPTWRGIVGAGASSPPGPAVDDRLNPPTAAGRG